MTNRVCLVVPVYKAEPDSLEKLALSQGARVLGSYRMFIVTHPELDLTPYHKLCPQAEFVFFDRKFFESIDGYNALLLDRTFYEAFATFDFLLIYQPDAWVFRDELLLWCDQGFDYVGAPWINLDEAGSLQGGTCGNGGFSLRKTATFLRITQENYRVKGLQDLIRTHLHYRGGSWTYLIRYLLSALPKIALLIVPRLLGFKNTYRFFRDEEKIGEDRIFVHKILSNRKYRVPSLSEGHGFAWELQLEKLWEKYGRLPFGCHAWSRETYFGEPVLAFWRQYIPVPRNSEGGE